MSSSKNLKSETKVRASLRKKLCHVYASELINRRESELSYLNSKFKLKLFGIGNL